MLADFGIAHLLGEDELVPEGTIMTTISYTPPETFDPGPPTPA